MVPVGICLLKVNNRDTRARCEICSKLTIKTLERRYWRCYGVFIVNFEHTSHLVLVFLLLTLSKYSKVPNKGGSPNKRGGGGGGWENFPKINKRGGGGVPEYQFSGSRF